MNPILLAALYALIGDVLATFLAAALTVAVRGKVRQGAVGTLLGASGGFILGAAFLDLIGEAQQRSHNDFVVAAGVALGLLLMIVLEFVLGKFGMGEEKEEDEEGEKDKPSKRESSPEGRVRRAGIISVGMAIHNVPEALPIGAALVISPALSLLVAGLLTIETFAESGSIAGELLEGRASAAQIFALTMWPSVFSMVGAPIGVVLAGISPVILALTLALAAGIMLFITGEVWGDSRKDAGEAWSSIGLLVGVVLALVTSTIGRGAG